MKKERKLTLDKNFVPCEVYENEEYYPNGIFVFNITRIIEHIDSGKLNAETEEINVIEWYGGTNGQGFQASARTVDQSPKKQPES